jgi:hypothetical protein
MRYELADLAAQVGRFGQLTSLQSVFDAADRYQELQSHSGPTSHRAWRRWRSSEISSCAEDTDSVLFPLVNFPALDFHLPPEWYPPKWEEAPGQDVDDLADKAIAIIQGEGIPLVWVPRPETVSALVRSADADARDTILLASRDGISDDCTAVLTEITDAELLPLADLGAHALAALRDGRAAPAQALATNVSDTLLRDMDRRGVISGGPLGYFKYGKVRKRIEPVSDEALNRQYRAACVLAAAVPAPLGLPARGPRAGPIRPARHCTPRRPGTIHAG